MNQSSSATLRRPRRRGLLGLAALVGAIMLVLATIPAAAAAPGGTADRKFTARPLSGTRVQGAKSASGQLAKTDKSLLGMKSSAPVNVVVKLDYDSLAGYRGGVKGFAATSPSVTGRRLNLRTATVRRYAGYVQGVEGEFLRALRRPAARRQGRAAACAPSTAASPLKVAGNKVADLLASPAWPPSRRTTLRKPLTDSSPGSSAPPPSTTSSAGPPTPARA